MPEQPVSTLDVAGGIGRCDLVWDLADELTRPYRGTSDRPAEPDRRGVADRTVAYGVALIGRQPQDTLSQISEADITGTGIVEKPEESVS